MRREEKEILIRGWGWVRQAVGRVKSKRRIQASRREILLLNEHLLQDLGLDGEGRPVFHNPNNHETHRDNM